MFGKVAKLDFYIIYNEWGIHEIHHAIIKAMGLYTNVNIVSHDNVIRLAPWLEKEGFHRLQS